MAKRRGSKNIRTGNFLAGVFQSGSPVKGRGIRGKGIISKCCLFPFRCLSFPCQIFPEMSDFGGLHCEASKAQRKSWRQMVSVRLGLVFAFSFASLHLRVFALNPNPIA
jgi:hypothetical protein